MKSKGIDKKERKSEFKFHLKKEIAEEKEFKNFAAKEFLKGYAAIDSVYDKEKEINRLKK